MEETLWDSANKLRGTVESSEYKHVVLSLIFLKFASDKFEKRKQKLIREVKIVVDDKTKYPDWDKRDDIKSELKADLIVLLAENEYPPVERDEVYKEIFEQAKNFKNFRAA